MKKQLTIHVPNLSDTEELTNVFRSLYPSQTTFCFNGDMGAGKTTLIKVLCNDLGVQDEMSSPTFSIVNEYDARAHGPVYHFDLYRLRQPAELLEVGWYDYLSQDRIMFIEWPEMAGEHLPDERVDVHIEVDPTTQDRILTLTYDP